VTHIGKPHRRSNRGFSAVVLLLFFPAWLPGGIAAEPAAEVSGIAPAVSPYRPPEDTAEILKVDPPMQRYFSDRVTARTGSEDRLRQLVEAITLPTGLNFAYDAEATFDARTTFQRRRGNCVSFSILVVAVARKFGFEAFFQNVNLPERWDRFGDLIASVQHINVRVKTDDGEFVADLRPDLVPPTNVADLRALRDSRAFAEFYNDIGFFRLVHGDTQQALQFMIRATMVDPGCAAAWANRATLHMRLGDLTAARTCFERSLRIDAYGMTALTGYVTLLRAQGAVDDLRKMTKLESRAKRLQDRNPYYQEHLAERADAAGDVATAERLFRRALDLKADDPELWAGWASALQKLGREDEARRAAAKAEKLRSRLAAAPVYFAR
jgi:Flp pilus assembly protein TadD